MDDRTELRHVLARFASGVTVITVDIDGHPHGMTANAFMSGSLDPRLIVVSVAMSARTHAAIQATGAFGVSILSADQIADAACFAGRGPAFSGTFEIRAGVPVIASSLAWLAARVDSTHVVGDHTLFVGEVQELGTTPDAGPPLAYYGGTFCGVRELAQAPMPHGWYAELWG